MNSNQMMDFMKMQLVMSQKDNPVMSFVLLQVIEFAFGIIKLIIDGIKSKLKQLYDEKKKNMESRIDFLNVEKEIHEIEFERNYDGKQHKVEDYERTDAILYFITSLKDAKKLIYTNGIHIVNNGLEFNISENIKFKLIDLQFKDHEIALIKFKLYSEVITILEIRMYVEELLQSYLIYKRNKLGNKLYFFDQMALPEVDPMHRHMMNDIQINRNEKVQFTKNIFITSRTLGNVFFENRKEVESRLNFFMNEKKWYDEKGIPHTLGFMLHGAPGCGKTSCIKAIANITQRHIININLSKIKTKEQLKELFYDNKIFVSESSDIGQSCQNNYIIPINKRLYVIEDIDCLGDTILQKRDAKKRDENDNKDLKSNDKDHPIMKSNDKGLSNIEKHIMNVAKSLKNHPIMKEDVTLQQNDYEDHHGGLVVEGLGTEYDDKSTEGPDNLFSESTCIENLPQEPEKKNTELDLSTILNIIDGTLETPGRILIITSNYPEKLDHAFIRPGRIDMIIEFKKANRQIIKEMYESFYDEELTDIPESLDDYKWTPAEVSQILFKFFDNPKESLETLCNSDPQEYFKFSYFDK